MNEELNERSSNDDGQPEVKQKAKKQKKQTKAERVQEAAQRVLDAVETAQSNIERAYDVFVEEAQRHLAAVEGALEDLRNVREEEYQGWYDNLPESLQNSPVGEKLQVILDIDLDPLMPEVPEFEELDFSEIENAAQEILDTDYPQGFGRD